jgi:peptidoglycan/LPS O-acetylase OafA/YrhL
MPEPTERNRRYIPGLDGLRAIAVLAVIAYHLGFGWAGGGLLGVGVFFTLSGYLITDLLLAQLAQGRIHLRAFWLARARRLLPALFVMLIIVTAWVTVLGPQQPPEFRSAVATAAVYVNNWWLVFHDVSYFQAFETQGPLNHLWSLSVEEQFYILWPFLLVLGVAFIPELKSPTGTRVRLAGAALGCPLPAGARSIPGLLRDRHEGARAPCRRCPGRGVAEPSAAVEHHAPGTAHHRSIGHDRANGPRADVVHAG